MYKRQRDTMRAIGAAAVRLGDIAGRFCEQ
jgi:hypothetical protein